MLVRLSFKPLDATAIRLEASADTASVATTDGAPEFKTLPSLIRDLATQNAGKQVHLRAGRYATVSLSEVRITGTSAIAEGEHQQASSGEEDDDDFGQGLKLLKQVTGKTKPRGRGRGSGSATSRGVGNGRGRGGGQGRGQNVGSAPKGRAKRQAQPKSNPSGSDAEALQNSEIMNAWADVLSDQCGGPLPSIAERPGPAPEQATSSSAAGCGSYKGPIPIKSTTHPWRDEKGHAWVWSEEKQIPCNMGRAPK